MQINIVQAVLLGLCACLSSMPGLGGTTFGNYTLGRPLVAGLVVGLILGDMQTGIIVGAAIQVIYIALVTPGGTVSADVRAISYIGIPLAICAIKGMGLDGGGFGRSRWNPWNRSVLRDGHCEPGLAAYGMEGSGKG